MTTEQLTLKFNPANASQISAADLEEMRKLTDEQINILAEAFPNLPSRRSYLRLYDTNLKPHQQLYQLSTWQNLRNVRKFSNKKNLVAYDFFQVGRPVKQPVKTEKTQAKKVVVDLTAQEAADELRKSIKATITDKQKQKDLIKSINSVDQKIKSAVKAVKKPETADQEFDDGTT